MKKLWIHTVPGKDTNADQIFYFPQELPKFLRGYHKCSIKDAVKLAALIYRARYADNNSELMDADFDLQTILPVDVIRLQSSKSWRKQIIAAHFKDEGKSPEEAKEEFLKIIYEWPTFGTAFFDVKQTTHLNLPEIFIVGINKNGVNFIHQENKVSYIDYILIDNIFKKNDIFCYRISLQRMDFLTFPIGHLVTISST